MGQILPILPHGSDLVYRIRQDLESNMSGSNFVGRAHKRKEEVSHVRQLNELGERVVVGRYPAKPTASNSMALLLFFRYKRGEPAKSQRLLRLWR